MISVFKNKTNKTWQEQALIVQKEAESENQRLALGSLE